MIILGRKITSPRRIFSFLGPKSCFCRQKKPFPGHLPNFRPRESFIRGQKPHVRGRKLSSPAHSAEIFTPAKPDPTGFNRQCAHARSNSTPSPLAHCQRGAGYRGRLGKFCSEVVWLLWIMPIHEAILTLLHQSRDKVPTTVGAWSSGADRVWPSRMDNQNLRKTRRSTRRTF